MATEVKRRRGTTSEHSSFTGAEAELTVDLTKDTVVVHDGATQGGFPLLREDFSNVPTTAPFTHITLDTAIFDTTYTETGSETQGTLYWNSDEETLSLVTNGETIELGQKVEIHVKNQTGAQINKGEVVYASGTVGNSGRILVTKMIADGTVAAKRVLGVAAENIANGADGKVIKFGKLRKIDTTAFNEGDILWVSTTVAGAFQNTEPSQSAGDIALPIAFVVTDSASVGEIFIRVTPIDENEYQNYDAGLADIAGLTPTDSNFIVGDGTNWVGESGDTARTSLGLGTGDSPTFSGLTVNGSITVTGNVDGRDISDDGADLDELYTTIGLSALTAEEVNQLENIGETTTINATQWGYLGVLDQNLRTTDAVTFSTVDTGQGANELYAMNQDVQTTDAVTFATVNTGQGDNELYAMNQDVQTTDDVTFNVIDVTDKIESDSGYTSGITGAGTIYDMDDGNGSFFEIDNMRVRNELRAHIFKKDIVKASNAYLFITDAAEIAETSVIVDTTDTFRVLDGDDNATFNHGDLLWAKNIDDDASLQVTGVKIEVSVQPQFVWDTSEEVWNTSTITPNSYTEFASGTVSGGIHDGKTYTEYNIYEVTSGGTLNAGDTIVRVSDGSILNDASSQYSPFIDIYDGVETWADFQNVDKTKVRLGNLEGVSNASGYGLYTQNAFLTGALVVGDLTKVGNYLEYSGGNLSGVFNDIDFDSNTFSLETTNLRIDSQDEIIQIGSGDWVELGNLGSSEYGLSLNSNNYWKYNTLASTYFFKVGSATNFISFNTATNVLDIETNEFSLTAGSMTIDSSDGITIGANDFFKQDKTFSFGGGILTGNGTSLSIETTNLSIDSANEIITLGSGTTVTLGKIDANNFGLSLDANNFWKVSFGEYFFKVGSATNFISFDTSSETLDIETNTFDLNATTLVIDSGTNSGKIALGSTPPTAYNSGTGIYFDGTGKALIGNAAGNKIQFNGTNIDMQSTSFSLSGDGIDIDTAGAGIASPNPTQTQSNLSVDFKSATSGSPVISSDVDLIEGERVRVLQIVFDYDISGGDAAYDIRIVPQFRDSSSGTWSNPAMNLPIITYPSTANSYFNTSPLTATLSDESTGSTTEFKILGGITSITDKVSIYIAADPNSIDYNTYDAFRFIAYHQGGAEVTGSFSGDMYVRKYCPSTAINPEGFTIRQSDTIYQETVIMQDKLPIRQDKTLLFV
jgi:hypothetical protein